MSFVTQNPPDGTPTWIDLGIPDPERAMAFYGALFGWEFEVGPPESGGYTQCLLGGRRVAALVRNPDPDATEFWWNMYLATGDCDATARRVVDAGGTLVTAPMDVLDQGRMAIAKDPVGAQFGLWQGRARRATARYPPRPGPPRGSTRRCSASPSTATPTCPTSTSPSCAAPTATRSAASWASRGRRRRPGRPCSRSPTPTPRSPGPPTPAAPPAPPRTSST